MVAAILVTVREANLGLILVPGLMAIIRLMGDRLSVLIVVLLQRVTTGGTIGVAALFPQRPLHLDLQPHLRRRFRWLLQRLPL